jgi:hypothetical protein
MSPEAISKAHANALQAVSLWNEDDRASWDERAATLEYERKDTCPNRQHAELLAYWQIAKEIKR